MPIGLKIEVESARVEAMLQRFIHGLAERTPMNQQVGLRAAELTRNHLGAIAQSRHRTAQALGAAPTGFWAQALEKTSSVADEEGATISIGSPGIGRAAHDVTIAPTGGKKYLTIPAIADAYGKLARTFPDLTPMIRYKDGERRAVALGKSSGTGKEKTFEVFYWLVKNVFQPQERTLLPTDEEYRLAALAGVRDYIDFMLADG